MSDFSAFMAIGPTCGGFNPLGQWELMADMPFDLTHGDESSRIIIPKGFISDGPSIPAIARVWFNPADSRYMKAAILHDWMLASGEYTPRQCAAAFRDALKAGQVGALTVAIMWMAVLIWTTVRQ